MIVRMFQLLFCMTFILALELMHAVFDKGCFAIMLIMNFLLQFVRELAGKLQHCLNSQFVSEVLRMFLNECRVRVLPIYQFILARAIVWTKRVCL